MQTLGLSDSTPHTESRLKSLFWPSIQTGSDVDYLGMQGYWVCTIVAIISLCVLTANSHLILALIVSSYFYLGGVGVRQRSSYAAAMVLFMYSLDTIPIIRTAQLGGIVLRILLLSLLLSNFRATWIASHWKGDSEEAALPQRLGGTWSDTFANLLPLWLWPKLRIPYYIYSSLIAALTVVGLIIQYSHRD